MAKVFPSALLVVGLTTLRVVNPVSAQTAPVPGVPAPTVKLPALLISAGGGVSGDGNAPAVSGSAQYLWGRYLALEGEGTYWSDFTTADFPSYQGFPTGPFHSSVKRRAWTAGLNVTFRAPFGRAAWYAGAGVMIQNWKHEERATVESCVPPPGSPQYWCEEITRPYEARETGAALQGLTGADVRVAGPLAAYGQIQFTSARDSWVRLIGGVRVTARSRDAARIDRPRIERLARETGPPSEAVPAPVPRTKPEQAVGKTVRISFANGSQRKARFVGLTPSEVVVREGDAGERRYPLTDVRLVETVHHGALIGGLIGFAIPSAIGFVAASSCGDQGECVGAALLWGAIGAAGGATFGGLNDRANAPKHVVYAAPVRAVHVVPIVGPSRAGVGVFFSW